MPQLIHDDCRHFLGDRPCSFHKETGVHCDGCPHYDRIESRILIVKLDAVGDVLRTTSILEGLKIKHPKSRVTWLTMKESIELFVNNPFVDVVLDYGAESFLRVQVEEYDLVVNLDASPKSARIAEAARGKAKLGFGYDKKGHVYPYNKEAHPWFEMGVFDDVKKANTRTYQEIIHGICGLGPDIGSVILRLTDNERAESRDFADKHGMAPGRLVIGLNTGAGGRWKHKKWTLDGYSRLIGVLSRELDPHILLFGGPLEVERNAELSRVDKARVIDTGCDNTIRSFAAKMDLCDVVVTGDTLALHVAVGLKKKVVALFGPTSYHEIELYGRGEKVAPKMDCLCCYRSDCNIRPTCMETITVEDVMGAIRRLVDKR